MKKFLLTLAVLAFAASSISAQDAKVTPQKQAVEMKKHECKDHKDGQACNKPADQQCPDCKEKAAAAPKHECKKGEGKECDKAMAPKHECKEGMKDCKKAEGMKHECKKGEGKECDKAKNMAPKPDRKLMEGKECDKAKNMAPKHECKHEEGKACDKPADQQCPDCKEKAAKKN